MKAYKTPTRASCLGGRIFIHLFRAYSSALVTDRASTHMAGRTATGA